MSGGKLLIGLLFFILTVGVSYLCLFSPSNNSIEGIIKNVVYKASKDVSKYSESNTTDFTKLIVKNLELQIDLNSSRNIQFSKDILSKTENLQNLIQNILASKTNGNIDKALPDGVIQNNLSNSLVNLSSDVLKNLPETIHSSLPDIPNASLFILDFSYQYPLFIL